MRVVVGNTKRTRTGKRMQVATQIRQEGWIERMKEETKNGITLPQAFTVGFALYSIAQLVLAIWWAATLSANLSNLNLSIQADKSEQKQKIQQLENSQQDLQQRLQDLRIKIGIIEGNKK